MSSLGDFEQMRSSSSSSSCRPNELVYTIELPSVGAANEVVLDVSERRLCLQFKEVYSLSIALPYPVVDNKGVAKFDKQRKSLTLTLPVKQREVEKEVEKKVEKEVVKEVEEKVVKEVEEKVVKEEEKEVEKEVVVIPPKNNSRQHARWVQEGLHLVDEGEGKGSLREFIQQQSQEALRTTTTVNRGIKEEEAVLLPQIVRETEVFLESPIFSGRRDGYVFKRGDLGMGYYLDTSSFSSTSTVVQLPPQQQVSPPFEFRETSTAVALLIQVSGIVKESCRVEFDLFSLDIQFEVEVEEAAKGGRRSFCLGLDLNEELCGGGIDVLTSKIDVAHQNMVVILMKNNPNEFWEAVEGKQVFMEREFRDHPKGPSIPIIDSINVKEDATGKIIETAFQQLQFSNNEVLFELD